MARLPSGLVLVVTLSLLTLLVCAALIMERARHQRARARIPFVVHVNGTRGKSSVTRLIAAGLREGGLLTWAKVTGTLPRLIDEHGEDRPIVRHAGSSIGEQRAVIAEASRRGVQALVIECMALKPEYQRVSEDGLLRASIGVITNIRADHIEVFGSDLLSMVDALARTIPRGQILFTAERALYAPLHEAARRRGAECVQTSPDSVDAETMARFAYHEHADNVALALAVCEHLGVERSVALRGMLQCTPDVGALRPITWQENGRSVLFFNAMAANDPDSTAQLYRDLVGGRPASLDERRCIVVNSRQDRPARTRQMARLMVALAADRVYAIGSGAHELRDQALALGLPSAQLTILEGAAPQMAQQLLHAANPRAVVFAMGNIAGPGLALADEIESRAASATRDMAEPLAAEVRTAA